MGDALPQTRRLLGTRKDGCAIKASQCSGHFTGSNHEYTLSEPTAVAYSADWFNPDTCPPMEFAIPWSTRLFNTWKTSIAMNNRQHSTGSDHDYTHSEPNTVTLSGDWLHLDTVSSMRGALPQTRMLLNTWKMVSPWRLANVQAILQDHTIITHFLSLLQWHTVLTGSIRIMSAHRICYTVDHKAVNTW